MAKDPAYDADWQKWIRQARRQIGMVDLADIIYVHSEHYWQRQNSRDGQTPPAGGPGLPTDDADDLGVADDRAPVRLVLFGEREGRIALANRRKDPLYLFNSLHRQLGYPEVPRPKPDESGQTLLPQLARRLEQLETRIKLVEEEQRGGIDLTKFYVRPDSPP
jgi:hypothetical protein